MKPTLDDLDEGILKNGERLNNIRYADEPVVLEAVWKAYNLE